MYKLTCLSVAHFQVIVSWLLSWDVVFITRTDIASNIVAVFSPINEDHIATLSGSGAAFVLSHTDTGIVIATGAFGTLITPAHAEK